MKSVFTTLLLLMSSFSAMAASSTAQQYEIAQDELVYMETSEGLIIYQVLPQVSPKHAERFKALVNEGWYDGLEFYRVIDGFVAQAGEGEREWNNVKGKPGNNKSPLKGELTRPLSDNFELIQSPELLAPETGFIDSVPAGRDPKTKEEWFLHCPGMVAMARGNDVNSGATEFYINIGQAPRHLDRNMSVFARVVYGLEAAQRMTRGDRQKGGVVQPISARAQILSAKLGTQIDKTKQKQVKVDKVKSKRFQQRLASARNKTHPFYVYPGNGNLDVCYIQPHIEVN